MSGPARGSSGHTVHYFSPRQAPTHNSNEHHHPSLIDLFYSPCFVLPDLGASFLPDFLAALRLCSRASTIPSLLGHSKSSQSEVRQTVTRNAMERLITQMGKRQSQTGPLSISV